MRKVHTLLIFVAASLLLNALVFLLAMFVDFSQRSTKLQTGKITRSHTGKYSYSQMGNEVFRCKPPVFLSKGGECDESLMRQEVTATLKSVPALFKETYVATEIYSSGRLLWTQTDQELRQAWGFTLVIELNTVLAVVGVVLFVPTKRHLTNRQDARMVE